MSRTAPCHTRAVRAWLLRLLNAPVLPGDDEITVSRKRLLTAGGLGVPVMLVVIGVVYLAYGEPVAGALYVGTGVWVLLNVVAFARYHHNYELAFWLVAIPVLPVHLAVILTLGDILHSGAIVFWGLAFPVATAVVFVPVRKVLPLFALYVVNVVVAGVIGSSDRSQVPAGAEKAILIANLLGLSVFAVGTLAIFVNQRDRAFRLLGEEQRKVRSLLLSILPEEIADELANSRHVIADQFEDVSVLFADVVGFTPMSADMTPVELVEVLDELFGCFDDLVEDAGLEKIKTIGDCYMVAAGIPRPHAEHATALVSLALEMQRVAQARTFHGRQLALRIGINSGSVVAGVIGRRKFSYDLWGDVVNTASRMESHGIAGCVQITESTHALVRDAFACQPRGAIEVKGKGGLRVWVVDRPAKRRPMPHASGSAARRGGV